MHTIVHAKNRHAGQRSVISGLRKSGFVPAVVYGFQIDSTPIAINARDFEKTLRENGKNAVITLDIEGKKINVVLNDAQKDTLKDRLVHLDFLAVNMDQSLEIDIPIIVKGESIGIKNGGVLQQPSREVKLSVIPSEIPENIEVDVSTLDIGDRLAVSDIRHKIPYNIISDDDLILVAISAPSSSEDTDAKTEIPQPIEEAGIANNPQ